MNVKTTTPVDAGSISGQYSRKRRISGSRLPLAAKVLSSALSLALVLGGTAGITGADTSQFQGGGALEADMNAKDKGGGRGKGIQLEKLDRGLVAASTSEGVFLSWRLLGDEATGYSDKGLTGTDFNVYRDGIKIAQLQTAPTMSTARAILLLVMKLPR